MNIVLAQQTFPTGQMLQLVQGDITSEQVDAIVNAANSYLRHGGGVAGVISRRGGSVIQQESDAWIAKNGPVTHADPAYTSAGDLPSRYVIHAVGPVWGEGDEDNKLAAAVTGSLRLAGSLGLASIAFPAISTGIFGFPKERAAGIIFAAIERYAAENPGSSVKLVRLTLFDQPAITAFRNVWREQGRGK
jgi:O-acetyl-ADP-ribose deacetylase (regulator of RNase III)